MYPPAHSMALACDSGTVRGRCLSHPGVRTSHAMPISLLMQAVSPLIQATFQDTDFKLAADRSADDLLLYVSPKLASLYDPV